MLRRFAGNGEVSHPGKRQVERHRTPPGRSIRLGPLPLRTVRKRRAVLDRLEGLPLRIRIHLHGPCRGVCHREGHLDVRQPSSIEPERVIQAAGVEHLEDGLDVRGIEKPEVPGIVGQTDHRAGARSSIRRLPLRHYTETTLVEAHGRRLAERAWVGEGRHGSLIGVVGVVACAVRPHPEGVRGPRIQVVDHRRGRVTTRRSHSDVFALMDLPIFDLKVILSRRVVLPGEHAGGARDGGTAQAGGGRIAAATSSAATTTRVVRQARLRERGTITAPTTADATM